MKFLQFVHLPTFSALSRRERLLAAGVFVVVAVVLLDRVVLGPWWQHSTTVRQEVQRLEQALRARQQLLHREPQILGDVEAYREYLRGGTSRGPDMAALLREIEAMGEKSGMSLGEVKPLVGEANELYQEYTIEVQYQGSTQQWLHFIYLLDTSTVLFDIERATAARADEGLDLVEGSLRLTSKVMRQQEAS